MIRSIRPVRAALLFAAALADLQESDAAKIPSATDVTLFAGDKEEGQVIALDIQAGQMPVPNGKIEVINCLELGYNDDGCKVWAVMVQQDSFANMANMAVAAVEYAKRHKADQFATAAIALIGGAKQNLIGTRWTTILVRETTIEGVDHDVRDAGQASFALDEKGSSIVFDDKNPTQLCVFNATEISRWMDMDESAVVEFADGDSAHAISSEDLKALTSTDGAFLRRTNGQTVVISDGRNNVVFAFKEGKLEFRGFYEGAYEFALDENGEVADDKLLAFAGDPDTVGGMSYTTLELEELPTQARELLGYSDASASAS